MSKAAPSKSLFSKEYDAFLTLLRKAREDAGMTQAEAAAKLKRHQSYVSKCESGERRVDVVELIAFCKAYELAPTQFIALMVVS
ncbi:MAG: helix-turn-helix transcriptional regulator [Chthoniobacteraceae bacterium]